MPLTRTETMKHIITLIFLFLLLSCKEQSLARCEYGESGANLSVSIDLRCEKLLDEAYDKAVKDGFCYKFKEGEVIYSENVVHPDPEKCNALWDEAKKKCYALPPPGPDDIDQVSGSAIYHKGKPVMVDGKLVCP